ncbi:MAG TPA: alpha/beta fold hydrolase [Solirubrobacter sp.]|nr:alpha/beta fold hydrolase [Solirubrobacter sp.]
MTVVFLHGLAGSRMTYAWLPDVVAGHEVVRPDLRGHGEAARTPGAYLISDYAQDALEVLRATGPAFVVGHSLGGAAAWCVAQRAPELVLGALLEDPPLYMGEPAEHAANPAVPHFAQLQRLAGRPEAAIAERLAAEPYGPDPTRRAADVAAPDAMAARAYALAHLDPAALDPVLDGTLLAATDTTAPVTVPVHVLAAGLAPAFTPEHERRLAASHPAVTVARVASAGHSIHDERDHRTAYLDAVTALLTR